MKVALGKGKFMQELDVNRFTYAMLESRNSRYRATEGAEEERNSGSEEQWVQRNSKYTGTLGTEEQRNSGYRGTESAQEQRNSGYRATVDQRNSGYRGTVGTQEQRVRRNSRYRGTVGTEEQYRNIGKLKCKIKNYLLRRHLKHVNGFPRRKSKTVRWFLSRTFPEALSHGTKLVPRTSPGKWPMVSNQLAESKFHLEK
ncbi:hypothetical protein P5673_011495 [Acropora cervicornis]|uniref:Uncharacterized protein n=1 Tax=Acropora cervicornis TaxID=6130 RepID=A0AAD9QP33_ACRCE|nr:hypothetical protein P5673_011495 [Acropora cervicornis]